MPKQSPSDRLRAICLALPDAEEVVLRRGPTYRIADKIFGGWNIAGVYTAASGLPLEVVDLNACATEFGSTSFNGGPAGLLRNTSGSISSSRHNNPTVGNFGGNSAGGFPNAFSNPDAVVSQFRYPTFADNRLGMGAIRGDLGRSGRRSVGGKGAHGALASGVTRPVNTDYLAGEPGRVRHTIRRRHAGHDLHEFGRASAHNRNAL